MKTLERVRAFSHDGRTPIYVPVVDFKLAFHPEIAARLARIEELKCTFSNIINLATADPANFAIERGYISRKGSPKPTRFFLIGSSTYSSCFTGDKARQICVAFSNRSFPRAMAVIGQTLQKTEFVVPTFRNGASISTKRRKSLFQTKHRRVTNILNTPS